MLYQVCINFFVLKNHIESSLILIF